MTPSRRMITFGGINAPIEREAERVLALPHARRVTPQRRHQLSGARQIILGVPRRYGGYAHTQ